MTTSAQSVQLASRASFSIGPWSHTQPEGRQHAAAREAPLGRGVLEEILLPRELYVSMSRAGEGGSAHSNTQCPCGSPPALRTMLCRQQVPCELFGENSLTQAHLQVPPFAHSFSVCSLLKLETLLKINESLMTVFFISCFFLSLKRFYKACAF